MTIPSCMSVEAFDNVLVMPFEEVEEGAEGLLGTPDLICVPDKVKASICKATLGSAQLMVPAIIPLVTDDPLKECKVTKAEVHEIHCIYHPISKVWIRRVRGF